MIGVDQVEDDRGPSKYLAWCGEGRYVVFDSSVTVGEIHQYIGGNNERPD